MRSSMFFVLLVSLLSVGVISIFFEPNYDRECSQLFGGKSDCVQHAVAFQCGEYHPQSGESCPGNALYVLGGVGPNMHSTHNLRCTTPIGDEPCGGWWTNMFTFCNGVTYWWNGESWQELVQ